MKLLVPDLYSVYLFIQTNLITSFYFSEIGMFCLISLVQVQNRYHNSVPRQLIVHSINCPPTVLLKNPISTDGRRSTWQRKMNERRKERTIFITYCLVFLVVIAEQDVINVTYIVLAM